MLGDDGFMGITIPTTFGGRGLNHMDSLLVIEEMARCCSTVGRITVEAKVGAIDPMMRYGSERQKRQAANYVFNGDKPAICITEPDAGSASTEMTTTAVKRGNKYIIDGRKH